jgi:hypothetical protein
MIKDVQLSSDKEGNIILKSCVANYLLRPLQLEDVCLFDPKIPPVNYLDFIDTKNFEDYSILTDVISDPPLTRHVMMEKYAQQVSICFIPFQNISDLKDAQGNFLPNFRLYNDNQNINKRPVMILNNIQNCRNSLNAGRPKDYLKKKHRKTRHFLHGQ